MSKLKIRQIFLTLTFILFSCALCWASGFFKDLDNLDEKIENLRRERKNMERANDAEIESIKEDRRKKETEYDRKTAELLYKRSKMVFDNFGVAFIEDSADLLLQAIGLNPENKKYRDYLKEIYMRHWKENKESVVNPEVLIRVNAIEQKIKTIITK